MAQMYRIIIETLVEEYRSPLEWAEKYEPITGNTGIVTVEKLCDPCMSANELKSCSRCEEGVISRRGVSVISGEFTDWDYS